MARAAIVAILTATAGGAYFLFAFPGLAQSAHGPGVFLFGGAIVVGIAAAVFALGLPDDPSAARRLPRAAQRAPH
jgi:hypothetical protein